MTGSRLRPLNVVLYSSAPGGAEVLAPVYRLLADNAEFDVSVLARDYALDRFRRNSVAALEAPWFTRGDVDSLGALRPDIVVTSATNVPEIDDSEICIWHNSRLLGVPTLGMLDQWQNYSLRFYGRGKPDPSVLPDFINCIDKVGEREMLAEGFPARRLVQFGQPYLAGVKEKATAIDRGTVRRDLGLDPTQSALLFVSEAIAEYYGRSMGYDQFDALEMFLRLCRRRPGDNRLLVKMHPREDHQKLRARFSQTAGTEILFLGDEISSLECLAAADEVFGMTSIMLIEAFSLGMPVISLQPGLVGKNNLVLARTGQIRTITSESEAENDSPWVPAPEMEIDYAFREREFLDFLRAQAKAG